MEAITKTEFESTHSSQDIDDKEFDLLAQNALELTEVLCFGRAENDPESAKRAMKEMIAYWIERGGTRGVCGSTNPKSERIGNYSVTNREEKVITLHGVAVSPTALVILDRAGLRNCNL